MFIGEVEETGIIEPVVFPRVEPVVFPRVEPADEPVPSRTEAEDPVPEPAAAV
jgi:hypothetical protein